MRRILIDECINPRLGPRLRTLLPDHVVETVRDLGWAGQPDHILIPQLQGRFDAFLTIDKGFEHEHNVEKLTFGVVVLETANNQMPSYERLLEDLIGQIRSISAGSPRKRSGTLKIITDSESGFHLYSSQRRMTTIRYSRHFLTLILAAIALLLTSRFLILIPGGDTRFLSSLALVSALHATSLAISLRRGTPAPSRIAFVALATVLCAVASMLALLLAAWIPFPSALGDSARIILVLALASASGSSGYWLLVRLFWLKSLTFVDLITTLALCVPATLLSWVGAGMVTSQGAAMPTSIAWDIAGLVPTAAWWTAFSFSL